MAVATCPECHNALKLGRSIHEGQIVVCGRCRVTLEVVDVDPIEVDTFVGNAKKQKRKADYQPKDDWYMDEMEDRERNKRKRKSNRKLQSA